MRPIEDNPVLLGLGQREDYSFVSFYVNGLTYSARIERTAVGYWRGEVFSSGTDTTSFAIVHSHREVYVYEDRDRVAAWLSKHLHNALQWPAITIADRRMVEYTNDNLESLIRFPGMWGGPEATELQALQAMEFRDNILYRYNDFLRGVFAKSYRNLPACQILQRQYPEESEIDIITRVSELMGKFNQVLLDSDR